LLDVTHYRREKQIAYNKKHGITPKSVIRSKQQSLSADAELETEGREINQAIVAESEEDSTMEIIAELERDMLEAAGKLEFERAGHLRDQITSLKEKAGVANKAKPAKKAVDYRNIK